MDLGDAEHVAVALAAVADDVFELTSPTGVVGAAVGEPYLEVAAASLSSEGKRLLRRQTVYGVGSRDGIGVGCAGCETLQIESNLVGLVYLIFLICSIGNNGGSTLHGNHNVVIITYCCVSSCGKPVVKGGCGRCFAGYLTIYIRS